MKRILYALLLFGLGTGRFAHAGDSKVSYPIGLDAAVHAVLTAHAELTGADVELPMKVEAKSEEPMLVAGPIEPVKVPGQSSDSEWSRGRVRLRCAEPGACMPFYVLVHVPPTAKVVATKVVATKLVDDTSPLPAVLHSGARVFLLIDSGRLHLRVPVTCLQGGIAGSMIHVAALAHGRIYEAAIVDGTTVRGSL